MINGNICSGQQPTSGGGGGGSLDEECKEGRIPLASSPFKQTSCPAGLMLMALRHACNGLYISPIFDLYVKKRTRFAARLGRPIPQWHSHLLTHHQQRRRYKSRPCDAASRDIEVAVQSWAAASSLTRSQSNENFRIRCCVIDELIERKREKNPFNLIRKKFDTFVPTFDRRRNVVLQYIISFPTFWGGVWDRKR